MNVAQYNKIVFISCNQQTGISAKCASFLSPSAAPGRVFCLPPPSPALQEPSRPCNSQMMPSVCTMQHSTTELLCRPLLLHHRNVAVTVCVFLLKLITGKLLTTVNFFHTQIGDRGG